MKLGNMLLSLLIIVLTLLLGLSIWGAALGRSVAHEDILRGQEQIVNQLTYISCILLVPDTERTPDVVAQCQVGS